MNFKPIIFTLKFGINKCYIIKGDSSIMIDGGPPHQANNFIKQISALNLSPEEIKLVILTHGDFDHTGSAKDIKEVTGAKVAIHENDRNLLEEGIFNWPAGVTGWGKFIHFSMMPLVRKIQIRKLSPDILLSKDDFPLDEYGIDGRIIHTPGHTLGSVSVLLSNGDAFVGCMAHNGFPFRRSPGPPIFANDLDRLKESWYMLREKGAKTIYPAHGKPFKIEKITTSKFLASKLS
jgi:hydroxyacylglutathione hydrolase